jgi:hypothetical protein
MHHLKHPAIPLLSSYANNGVPVLLKSEPWSLEQKDAAMKRGCHPSASEYTPFLRDEMAAMRRKGFFIVLPYELLREHPGLCISPIGCIPQRDRRPRMINDYSFSFVNQNSQKLAPAEAMQWGKTLDRVLVLWYIYYADRRQGPVLLSKTDLADGFYRIPLTPMGALKLAVPFPHSPSEPKLLAIPTVLPMGWTESPPAFSAVTETIADIINMDLECEAEPVPPAHNLEAAASTPTPLLPSVPDPSPIIDTGPKRPKLAYVDVFVDDFIKLCQGWLNSLRVRRSTYHTIDAILRPNDNDDVAREMPISVRKLKKGDDFWSTQKVILGWFIDTVNLTIALPKHRQDRLLTILTEVISKSTVSLKQWQKLLGELRSMSLAIPGSRGCFSFLQDALKPNLNKVHITTLVRDQLQDFLWLARDVAARPTHLAEVVPSAPTYLGSMDASKSGMGGVWFPQDIKFPGATPCF